MVPGFRIRTRVDYDPQHVLKRERRRARRFAYRSGGYWRSIATRLLRVKAGPAEPRRSPHLHTKLLRRQTRYQVAGSGLDAHAIGGIAPTETGDRTGPRKIARALEIGGSVEGSQYAGNPYLLKALRKAGPKLAEIYADTYSS